MKFFKCENCGSELTKNADNTYTCGYCKRTYYDDSLEKAYERVYQNLQGTVQGIVTEELLKQKIEQIANCRQALYKARNGQFVNSSEVLKWSEEILKLSPDDAQANFYAIAAKKRWNELNKFMGQLNAREVAYLVEGFVDYLTKDGQFAEECVLSLSDLIDRAFDVTSPAYGDCHKKIVKADEIARSGIFDVELSRNVFVAYSSKDKEKAYELVEHLESNGFTCFIAMRNLAKGVDAELKYNERLKKAIDSCQIFLLVSSKNSRTRNCDAYRIEMQYVKDCDLKNASNIATAKAQYDLYLEKNRNRCKPRLEYLIDEYGVSPYEKLVRQFFGGLTWCTSLEGVLNEVFEIIEGAELDETAEEKLARERAEFEAQKAEFENLKKAESERLKKQAEEESLARERAEFEKQKAEFERQKTEEARLKKEAEEAERKRKEELDRKKQLEEEKKRQAEEERKRKENLESQKLYWEKARLQQAQNFEVKKEEFEIKNGILIKYNGKSEKVTIPSTVMWIGPSAFSRCRGITEVIIPKSVTSIGYAAFEYCVNLATLTIPSSVKTVGAYAFNGCSKLKIVCDFESQPNGWDLKWNIENRPVLWKNAIANMTSNVEFEIKNGILTKYNGKSGKVIIPNTVMWIGPSAFSRCRGITEVVLPKSVTSIGYSAFEYCTNLATLTIPSSVNSMGAYAFIGCPNLKINCEATAQPVNWDKKWNPDNRPVTWRKENKPVSPTISYTTQPTTPTVNNAAKPTPPPTSPLSDFEIENGVLKKYKGKGGEVVIPNGVTCIADEAFALCDAVTTVKIPNSVTTIGNRAFMDSANLASVQIPNSVTEIGAGAFDHCTSLTNIKISNAVSKIPRKMFFGCLKLTNIEIPDSVVSIGNDAFGICTTLEKIYLPTSVTEIGENAFSCCFRATIYTGHLEKPKGWKKSLLPKGSWNPDKRPVKWGATRNQFDKA